MRRIIPVLSGNALETYDFCLYGFLAPTFASLFFPESLDQSSALIMSFGVFLIAYISRPIGILFWGHIADKHGRKPVLMGTLIVMSIPALGIACVPSYNDIGGWAIFLILFFRLLQGFAFGGEFPTAMVTVYELAPNNRKGFFTSFVDTIANVGLVISILLIIIFSSLLTDKQFLAWGWRLLFLFSLLFILVLAYIRMNLIETNDKSSDKYRFPVIKALKKSWKEVLKIVFYMSTPGILFYSFAFHSSVIVEQYSGEKLSHTNILWIEFISIFYCSSLYPLMGYLSDIVGRIKFLTYSLIGLLVLCIPSYLLLVSHSVLQGLLGLLILGFFTATIIGTFVPLIVETSNPKCRVSTVGLGHGGAMLLFGASAPMISELLIKLTGLPYAPSFYIFLATLTSLIVLYLFNPNKAQKHAF